MPIVCEANISNRLNTGGESWRCTRFMSDGIGLVRLFVLAMALLPISRLLRNSHIQLLPLSQLHDHAFKPGDWGAMDSHLHVVPPVSTLLAEEPRRIQRIRSYTYTTNTTLYLHYQYDPIPAQLGMARV